jgi:hypothetical protein
MMSGAQIQSLSDKAARKAARDKRHPYVFWDDAEVDRVFASGENVIPFVGGYRPRGWKLIDERFVDTSGFGSDTESALSISQFARSIKIDLAKKETHGYALIESGQFQGYVGVFERKSC